jgi:hypothetical protein
MVTYSHGSFDWLTATGVASSYTVSTNNVEAKAIRFYWVGLQLTGTATNSQAVNERRGVGFVSNIDGTITQHCVGTTSLDASGNADCGSIWSNASSVITVSAAGALDGFLSVTSISAINFIITVGDVAPANITVFWEAWGGDEIQNVTVGAIAEPAATGTQNYTATGFTASPGQNEDQCVMFAGVQTINASGVGQQQDSGLQAGFATSTNTANQIVLVGNSDDGSGTMDTDGYNYTGQCMSMIVIAGGNPNARATLSAFGTDTFTLNWDARATTNRRNIYMAIKGGHWQAGSTTIAGNTLSSTTTVNLLSFNIKGVSLIGAMKAISTVNTSTAQDRMSFGSGGYVNRLNTISQNSAAVLDIDGVGTSEIDTSVSSERVLVYPSTTGTLQTAYSINNLKANSITFITNTAGGVASEWIGYLAFGDKKITAGTIGHPFII